jgi:hypothetical protein
VNLSDIFLNILLFGSDFPGFRFCVRFYFSYRSFQNAVLKAELDKVTKLYAAALKRLEQYEKPGKK